MFLIYESVIEYFVSPNCVSFRVSSFNVWYFRICYFWKKAILYKMFALASDNKFHRCLSMFAWICVLKEGSWHWWVEFMTKLLFKESKNRRISWPRSVKDISVVFRIVRWKISLIRFEELFINCQLALTEKLFKICFISEVLLLVAPWKVVLEYKIKQHIGKYWKINWKFCNEYG